MSQLNTGILWAFTGFQQTLFEIAQRVNIEKSNLTLLTKIENCAKKCYLKTLHIKADRNDYLKTFLSTLTSLLHLFILSTIIQKEEQIF